MRITHVSPEQQDDFLEDEEQEEYGQRSIFSTGWFRAVLVLLILAVVVVVSVPLIGGWFEPASSTKTASRPPEPTSRPSDAPSAVVPVPPAATPTSPTTIEPPKPEAQKSEPAPAAPLSQAPAVTPAPGASEKPAPTSPGPMTPARSAPKAEVSKALPPASKPAQAARAPQHTAALQPKAESRPAATGGSYWVQVGAFKETRNAEGLAKTLRAEGFSVQVASVERGGTLHVVRVGGFPDRAQAAAAREQLQGKGHQGFVAQGAAK